MKPANAQSRSMISPSPGIRPAGAPLAPPLPPASGDSLPIPNHQFCAPPPRADGADPVTAVDQPHPIHNRTRQITDAARLVLIGRHHAVPFVFFPFHHASEIADGRQ